jgi:hypothetical protein
MQSKDRMLYVSHKKETKKGFSSPRSAKFRKKICHISFLVSALQLV